MRFRSVVAIAFLLCAPAILLGQTLAFSVKNIPAAANKVTVVVDGPGISDKVWVCQSFAAGTSTYAFSTLVPAGGPYRVRAIVFKSTGESFPAILRSGKSTGSMVTAGGTTNVTINLADIAIALDATSPSSGAAGSLVTLKVNITDNDQVMAGRTTGRIWYASVPFALNMVVSQTFGLMSQPVSGPRQAAVDLRLPGTPGTLYYQFGESAPDFRNPNNQESPFVVGPNLQQGGALWQLTVTGTTSVALSVGQIPAGANKVTAVVDGGGMANRIVVSQSFSLGTPSISMSLGVPTGGPYRIRAVAFKSAPGSTSTPVVLRSGLVNGISVAGGVTNASVSLANVTVSVDGSTPASGNTGTPVTISINVSDTGALLESAISARVWSSSSLLAANFSGTAATGTWTAVGAGQWRAAVPVTLPSTAGSLYYQFAEAAGDFASTDATETPYLVWPDLTLASPQQIVVNLAGYLALSISNIPAAANRIAVVVDGGGISPRLLGTQVIAAGTSSTVLNMGAPQGGPYRARAIAWTSTGAAYPAILRTGKAGGITLAGASSAVSIALADVAFSVDGTTPGSVIPSAAYSIVLNYTDAGDVLEGAPGARIWYASTPYAQNVSAAQASGYLTTQGAGVWQTSTGMTAPVVPSTVYYQFGESAPGFASGGETPMLIWPNLSAGGQLKQITVLAGVLVTIATSPPGLSIVVDSVAGVSPQTFSWIQGSAHNIGVAVTQGAGGTRQVFTGWSDGGAATHNFTAPAGNATYTASFQTQHLLSTSVAPPGGGGISTNPALGDGFFNAGAVVQVTASPAAGYVLGSFSGDLSGDINPSSLTMNAPKSVTANFVALTAVTIATSPPGLALTVDSVAYAAPQTFLWTPGSTHTIAVAATQGSGSTRYRFANWSDGGAAAHTITVPANAVTYTAAHVTQFQLAATASPVQGGTVSVSPATDSFYDAGATVQLSVIAASGYFFAGFSGDAIGATTPVNISMTAPRSVTANFAELNSMTITSSPPGLAITVDGSSYTAPHTFAWAEGTVHTIAVTTTQGNGATRYQFTGWSDGGAVSHSITTPVAGAAYIASFKTQHQLSTSITPVGGGTLIVQPSSGDGFYDAGTSVQLSVSPNAGFVFKAYSGDAAGSTNPVTLVMNGPRSVSASFVATYQITVQTNPAGLSFQVNSVSYTSAQTFAWLPGSLHTVTAAASQGSAGTRHILASWNDGGAFTHAISAPAVAAVYTATYTTQHLLTLSSSPLAGGTLSANPASGDGYYNAGTSVQIAASAAGTYSFQSFSGDLSGTTTPGSVVMSAPRSVTGAFQAVGQTTIRTVPAGLSIEVDSVAYTAPVTFNWIAGVNHTIRVAPQQGTAGSRFNFVSWSDGGAASHTIVSAAGAVTVTANFSTQYQLSLITSPVSGGTVTASPSSLDGYYASGTVVQVAAAPASGFVFSGFSGALTGIATAGSVTMSAARDVTGAFTATAGVTITTAPSGLSITVDSVAYTSPHTFTWTAGSLHTVSVPAQQGASGTRYVYASWSDGGALAHSVTAPGTAATYTASYTTQYLLTRVANPMAAGSLGATPSSADGYYAAGASVQLTASPAAGYALSFFSGDLAGTTNPQSVVLSQPRSVTANFSTTNAGTNIAPYGLELTPFEGAASRQVFTMTFTDDNGWTDIAKTYIRLHESYAGSLGACIVEFRPASGLLYVMDDAAVNWIGPVAIGSSNPLQNSACSVDAAGSSFSGIGNTLTVNLALNFNPAFGSAAGREARKAVCQWAKDAAGAGEDQSCFGQWIPETPRPVLIPRYRLYNPINYAHFFTASQHERDVLVSRGFTPEDPVPGMVYAQPNTVSGVATRPLYRILFFPRNGAPIFHYWTRDREEYKSAIRQRTLNLGEGIDSFSLSAQTPGTYPSYRLRFLGPAPYPIYHYALQYEHDILVGAGGWGSLGVDGYLQPIAVADQVPSTASLNAGQKGPVISSVVNAASYQPGPVAAGELVQINGSGFSRFTQVSVDGVAVPVLSQTDRILEFVIPDAVSDRQTISLHVDDLGNRSEPLMLQVAAASPGVFTSDFLGRGRAVVLDSEPGTVALLLTGVGTQMLGASVGGYAAELLSLTPFENQPGRVVVKLKVPSEVTDDTATIMLESGGAISQPGVLVRVVR